MALTDQREPTVPRVPLSNRGMETQRSGADEQQKANDQRLEVPEFPGALLPAPSLLEDAYREAIRDIHHQRGTIPPDGAYAANVEAQAFRAFLSALSGAYSAIISEYRPDCTWAQNHPPPSDMHVLASAPGSGKTTLAKAFAVALTRVTERNPYPSGCVFLVHHIATAEAIFQELRSLLPPDSVAVFTTKHDAHKPFQDYSSTFRVDDLERHPVIVVTHEFFMGIRGEKARVYKRNGLTFPRVVTFIDERANEIAVYDVDPAALEGVLAFIQRDHQAPRELLEALLALVDFANQKRRRREQGIETPAHDRARWQAAVEATSYLRCDEAASYARSASVRMPTLDVDAVFGFANAIIEDRAFISRGNKGVINFVGYERALPRVPGMVLLDATADIDGITDVCRWRKHAELPPERYDRLKIIHVPSVATGNMRRWLSEKPEHIDAYVGQIQHLVRRHVPWGGRALVVCMKAVAVAQDILGWSEYLERFVNRTTPEDSHGSISDDEFTKERAWNLDGRLVAVTWFGGYGIGANLWREADAVIICDDYYLPQRVVKATLQGLRDHKATEGFLGNPESTWSDKLEHLHHGHILRWMKQMALRGKARVMDEHGVCGHQKLVITGDLLRVLQHRPKVFPGANITTEQTAQGSWMHRLVSLLLSSELPHEVSTKVIGDRLGVDWGNVSGNLTRQKHFRAILESAGWAYHRGRGQRLGCFRRLSSGKISNGGGSHHISAASMRLIGAL